MGIAGWLLSAIWQWLLGKIGLSSDQKLGRAEELNKQQAQTIQDIRLANEIKAEVDAMADSDIVKQLRASYERKP
jgi:hypothetical protein